MYCLLIKEIDLRENLAHRRHLVLKPGVIIRGDFAISVVQTILEGIEYDNYSEAAHKEFDDRFRANKFFKRIESL